MMFYRMEMKARLLEANINLDNPMSTLVVPWLSYSPLDPRFADSNPAGVDGFFQSVKNPKYDFLREGSKAVDPVS